jgi:predicted phosphodiesterase
MVVAIISDIHANKEALEAVLEDINKQGIPEKDIICLGDLVGYGPDPVDVIEMSYNWRIVLMGNHDEGVVKEPFLFNPVAKAALLWTKEVLKPIFLSSSAKKKRWEFLHSLAYNYKDGNIMYVHASPREPTMEYVLRSDCTNVFGEISDKLKDIFSRFEWLCFIGHTHDPGIIDQRGNFIHPSEFGYDTPFKFKKDDKYLINVGAVGQPRDGDRRACYVLFDQDQVVYRRIPYNYLLTVEKILKIPKIDPRCAERLEIGK